MFKSLVKLEPPSNRVFPRFAMSAELIRLNPLAPFSLGLTRQHLAFMLSEYFVWTRWNRIKNASKTKSRLLILKRGPLATSKWQNSLRASSDVHHALSYINKEALLVIKGCSHPTARLALLWAVSTFKPCPWWLNHFGTFQWRPGLTMSPRQCRTGGPQFTDETRLEPAAGIFSSD